MSVLPEWDAQIGECFFNVDNKIKRDGGSALNGWTIWIWPNVFIEAEHHCVWRTPDGELVDITPKQHGEAQTVFLPDPAKTYDNVNHRRLDNIRKALTSDPDVIEFIKLFAERSLLIENGTVKGSRMTVVDRRELSVLEGRLSELEAKMIAKYIRANDPCPCRSGKKYKKCHMRHRRV